MLAPACCTSTVSNTARKDERGTKCPFGEKIKQRECRQVRCGMLILSCKTGQPKEQAAQDKFVLFCFLKKHFTTKIGGEGSLWIRSHDKMFSCCRCGGCCGDKCMVLIEEIPIIAAACPVCSPYVFPLSYTCFEVLTLALQTAITPYFSIKNCQTFLPM